MTRHNRPAARTQERQDALIKLWATPDTSGDYDRVLAALNAIGGPPFLSRANLIQWRSELKLERVVAAAETPRVTKEARQSASDASRDRMPWGAIANYCRLNGLSTRGTQAEVLARVNVLRARYALPLWAIEADQRAGGHEAFPALSVSRGVGGAVRVVGVGE